MKIDEGKKNKMEFELSFKKKKKRQKINCIQQFNQQNEKSPLAIN